MVLGEVPAEDPGRHARGKQNLQDRARVLLHPVLELRTIAAVEREALASVSRRDREEVHGVGIAEVVRVPVAVPDRRSEGSAVQPAREAALAVRVSPPQGEQGAAQSVRRLRQGVRRRDQAHPDREQQGDSDPACGGRKQACHVGLLSCNNEMRRRSPTGIRRGRPSRRPSTTRCSGAAPRRWPNTSRPIRPSGPAIRAAWPSAALPAASRGARRGACEVP
jgi:hypothetical protein